MEASGAMAQARPQLLRLFNDIRITTSLVILLGCGRGAIQIEGTETFRCEARGGGPPGGPKYIIFFRVVEPFRCVRYFFEPRTLWH